MGIKKKSGEFRGRNRCRVLREHDDLILEAEKNIHYDNAVAAKDIIKGYFRGEFDVSEFDELVSEGIENAYTTEESNRLHQERLAKCLKRLCLSEKRKPEFLPAKTLHIGGYDIRVKPDAVFFEDGYIELVIYRAGLPDISEKGRSKDKALRSCLELYFLLLYGRTLVPEGRTMTIKASYYFLRKKTDHRNMLTDLDFFSGDGGNIVTLKEVYKGGDTGATAMDERYAQELSDFYEGDECSGEQCSGCHFKPVCEYQKAPEPFEKKTLKSKKGKIEPSQAQKKIIEFRKGICRVNATAGSGKTECITERGARMFEEGVDPREMLFITFTNAGATEMKERIVKKCRSRGLDVPVSDIQAMTFNSLAYIIVRDKYLDCGFSREPLVLDTVRNSVIIAEMLNDRVIAGLDYYNFGMNMSSCKGALACAAKVFEIIKALDIEPDDRDSEETVKNELAECGWSRFYTENAVAELLGLYRDYDRRLKEDNLLQYADQEPLMNLVLDKYPGYLDRFGYRHIVVDEFQDTNDIQIETIKKLMACPSFESLMVVGDDSQSIYGFRHTSNENIIHFFDKIGMEGEDLYLVENRRSTPEILGLANQVNDLNTEKVEKSMYATRGHGIEPTVNGFDKSEDEYKFIADTIEKKIKDGVLAEDIAFIAAKRSELVKMASELSERNIPWVLKNPMFLKDNSRVQAAVSIAKSFYRPESDILYFNYIIAKHDGDIFKDLTTAEILQEVHDLKQEFAGIELLEMEKQRVLFHEYLEAIKGTDEIYAHFLSLVYANEDLPSELEYIMNFSIFGDSLDKKLDQSYAGVVLTTAHSSKGLEWPVVFCSVSHFDSRQLHSGREQGKRIEEKRRLLFVSMTRARNELHLTGVYVAYGTREERTYNQFLMELLRLKPNGTIHPMYLEENAAIDEAVALAKRYPADGSLEGLYSALADIDGDDTYHEFLNYIAERESLPSLVNMITGFGELRRREIEKKKTKKKKKRKVPSALTPLGDNLLGIYESVIDKSSGQLSFSFS